MEYTELMSLAIAERNKVFADLPKNTKRVLIAQDVLDQLEKNKIQATSRYCNIPLKNLTRHDLEEGIHNLQTLVLNEEEVDTCQVCGDGAIFLSMVRLGNNYLLNKEYFNYQRSYADRSDILEFSFDHIGSFTESLFSILEMKMIEAAFEGNLRYAVWKHNCGEIDDEGLEQCEFMRKAYKELDTKRTRMKRIMESLIENKGELVIPSELLIEED